MELQARNPVLKNDSTIQSFEENDYFYCMANYSNFNSIKQQPFYYAHDNLGLHEETQMADARTAGDGRSTFKIASLFT